MGASYPRSEATRPQRTREEVAQTALETVAEGGPLASVLECLCRTMEDESLDRVIACIHPVNEDATMFRDTTAPSLDRSYCEAIDGLPVSSMIGPCCHAVTTRQTVVVPDLAADPKWAKYLKYAEPATVTRVGAVAAAFAFLIRRILAGKSVQSQCPGLGFRGRKDVALNRAA